MKKVLFVATIVHHFYFFHTPCFKMFKNHGWEVHVASNGTLELDGCDKCYDLPFDRFPLKPANLKVYKELKKIIDENDYDIIHCHTPSGGAIARLAALRARKKGTRVIYTAHGFHFCKGGSRSGWLIYYPIEKFLSLFTDCLITINSEDYDNARKRLWAKDVRKIHGVGCVLEKYTPLDKNEREKLRAGYGFKPGEKIILYVAELNKNKNQKMLIDAIKEIRKTHPQARLLLAGPDHYNGVYQNYANEQGVEVEFLGLRDDVPTLLKAVDIVAASSLREGLPLNIMEAMASGIPVVACDNRGHRELIKDGENGFLVSRNETDKMAQRICILMEDEALYKRMSENTREKVKQYSSENVLKELEKIYFE